MNQIDKALELKQSKETSAYTFRLKKHPMESLKKMCNKKDIRVSELLNIIVEDFLGGLRDGKKVH